MKTSITVRVTKEQRLQWAKHKNPAQRVRELICHINPDEDNMKSETIEIMLEDRTKDKIKNIKNFSTKIRHLINTTITDENVN